MISAAVLAIAATIATLQYAGAGSEAPRTVLEPGPVSVTVQMSDDDLMHITFVIAHTDKNCNLQTCFDSPLVWGSNADGIPSQNFISHIDVRLEGRIIEKGYNRPSHRRALSAYSDLTNIISITRETGGNSGVVIVRGGFEHTRYEARLNFNRDANITAREVTGTAFSKTRREESFYNTDYEFPDN